MMEAIIVAIVIFAVVFLVIQISLFTYRSIRYPDRGKIKKRLQDFSSDQYEVSITDIRKKRILSKIPFVNKLLSGAAGVNRFERLVAQSGSNYPVGFFLLLTAVLALSGYIPSSGGGRYAPYEPSIRGDNAMASELQDRHPWH